MEVYGDWVTFRKRLKWPLKELHFCTVILSEPWRLLPGRCKNGKKKLYIYISVLWLYVSFNKSSFSLNSGLSKHI